MARKTIAGLEAQLEVAARLRAGYEISIAGLRKEVQDTKITCTTLSDKYFNLMREYEWLKKHTEFTLEAFRALARPTSK